MSARKRAALVIAATTSLALMLGGTFAWFNNNQSVVNEFWGKGSDIIDNSSGGATLHDDFSDPDKHVYIENWGESTLYVRIKLSEYMEIGDGAGLKGTKAPNDGWIPNKDNHATPVVSGTNINETENWKPHVPDTNAVTCNLGTHKYWQWVMGGQKFYVPASENDRKDPNYVAQNTAATPFSNVSANLPQTLNATVVTKAQWIANGSPIGDFWVIDSKGWAYWANGLAPGQATGLLLAQVNLQKDQLPKDKEYYYAINVHAQMATKDGAENYEIFYNDDPEAQDLLDKIVNGGGSDNVTATKIEVTKDPTVKSYQAGDAFNPGGMEITVTYSDGSTEVIPAGSFAAKGIQVTAPNPLTQGNNSIKISYKGVETTYGVSVGAAAVKSIAVTTNPNKMTYVAGDTLDPVGMSITVTFTDNTTEAIRYGNFAARGVTVTAPNPLVEGYNTVKVSYSGKETTFTVPAVAAQVVVKSIAVSKNPTKMDYNVGDAFNGAGMEITATLSNDTTEVIPYNNFAAKGVLVTAPASLTQGSNSIKVTYGGKEATLNVTASAPQAAVVKGITISKSPTKIEYVAGDTFNPAGMIVTVTYTDNTTENITSDNFAAKNVVITASSPLIVGDNTIKVTYGGKEATFKVTATAPVTTVSSISIKTPPTKTVYKANENFAPAGLVITVTKSDNTTEDVAYSAANAADFSFSPSTVTASQTKVTITYKGKTADQAITVNPAQGNPGKLPIAKTEFRPDHEKGTDADKALYEDGAVAIFGLGVPMEFDTGSLGTVEKCYGYIPLKYFLGDNADTSGITVKAVNGLPTQGSAPLTSSVSGTAAGITVGKGVDLSGRTVGTDLSGQDCLIINWLPSTLKGAQSYQNDDSYYDVTVTLQQGDLVSDEITVRVVYVGVVGSDKR